ncbi:MAG TPA: GIY-YIG nuclease family protein [Hanamia sp.]
MKNGHHYYVYILECSDGSYYTGVTNNLERRVWEHETGFNTGCYTFKRRPVKLRYSTHTTDIKQAIAWEKQIKGWSRKKKEALFNEDWEEIKRLAQNYTEHPRNPPSTLRQAQGDNP